MDDQLIKRLRRSAQRADLWRTSRDALIVIAHRAGASYREIAAEVGLSHAGVMKIVAKAEEIGLPPHVLPPSHGDAAQDDFERPEPGKQPRQDPGRL